MRGACLTQVVRFIHRALALCAPNWIVSRYLIADLLDTHTAKSALACVSDGMGNVEAVVCPTAAVVRPALPKANKPAGDNAVGALLWYRSHGRRVSAGSVLCNPECGHQLASGYLNRPIACGVRVNLAEKRSSEFYRIAQADDFAGHFLLLGLRPCPLVRTQEEAMSTRRYRQHRTSLLLVNSLALGGR